MTNCSCPFTISTCTSCDHLKINIMTGAFTAAQAQGVSNDSKLQFTTQIRIVEGLTYGHEELL
jgi:hypothetical protein